MKLLTGLVLCGCCFGQTFTIDSPTAGQAITGYSGFFFSGHAAAAPSGDHVCWSVDSHPIQPSSCVSSSDGIRFSMPWNTFSSSNGTHLVSATLYDALGTAVATAAPVSFTNPNNWPIASAPIMTVTTGTALTSNWSGTPSAATAIGVTFAGGGTTDSKTIYWYTDGFLQSQLNTTSASGSFQIDTTPFINGPHTLAVVAVDNTTGATYNCGGVNNTFSGMTEWSAIVTFSNTAIPAELRSNFREVYVTPGGTVQLAPVLLNTDSTPVSSATFDYYSQNQGVATVSAGGLVTGVATGNTNIRIMNPSITLTDVLCQGPCSNGVFSSASQPFQTSQLGSVIATTSVHGWTVGFYEISNVDNNHLISLKLCTNGACVPAQGALSPAFTNTGAGTVSVGKSRSVWVFTNPSNLLYHYGSDNLIHTTFGASSQYVFSGFQSMSAVSTDQPYAGTTPTNGFITDYRNAKFTHFETGTGSPPAFTDNQTAWQNSITAGVTNTLATVPGFGLILAGDSWMRSSDALYQSTRGPSVVGGATWNPAPLTHIFNAWAGRAIVIEMQDETNSSWDHRPQQGALTWTNGLTSIVAASGICTINAVNWSTNGARLVAIFGATTSGLNSIIGSSLYSQGNQQPNSYTISCPSVANGTYTSSTDPNLLIEPYVAAWFNSSNGSTTSPNDYVHGDAFIKMRQWITAASSNRPCADWPNAASTSTEAIFNWENPSAPGPQADCATMYVTSQGTPYLRSNSNSQFTVATYDHVRSNAGNGWSFNSPLLVEVGTTAVNHGIQGYGCTVLSFSGDTITCSAPHKLFNVFQGVSKVILSGMSNSADNGNYMIMSAPTANTLTVARAASSFVATGGSSTGGTITFSPSGYTEPLSFISASGTLIPNTGTGGLGAEIGDPFTTGTLDPNISRHRCEKFTITGNANAAFNSSSGRVFIYPCYNVDPVINRNLNFWLELPNGSSSSGTASIIADNLFVLGRNGSNGGGADSRGTFATVMHAVGNLPSAGMRMYGIANNPQGFFQSAGFTGLITTSFIDNFTDGALPGPTNGCNQTNQLYAHPRWTDGASTQLFHAASMGARLLTKNAKYLLQPRLPSPDYGPSMECSARGGSAGKVVTCVNMSDNPQTRTFDVTAYVASGQNFIRYQATNTGITVTVINSGTTTDTITLPPSGAVQYTFPVSFNTELLTPVMSIRLADVASASKIAIRYNYDPFWLDIANLTVDCGTGAACQLPVDQSIGPVSYRILFLDINGKLLATSDVQTL